MRVIRPPRTGLLPLPYLHMDGTTMRWRKMEAEARKELRKSSDRIEFSSRGVPSGRTSDWRLGSSPSKHKDKR